MNIKNRGNEYQAALGQEFFDACPKAVFAALAVSLVSGGGEHLEEATSCLRAESQTLFDNGIVAQAPPKS